MEDDTLILWKSEIMRKKELISTHALLVEVAQYLIENENMPAGRMCRYHALSVTPLGVHKSKQDHYEAITVLFNIIEGEFEQTRIPPVSR
ncbi:UPF0058 family protein [Halorubrum sp. N11]|uniref:UPF0058 family protein n=1 Tax=Halorubrum sp. N11 TaxID=3402276 RepID=UPI003EBF426B